MASSRIAVRLSNAKASDFLKAVSEDVNLNNLHGRIRNLYDELRCLDRCSELNVLDAESTTKVREKWDDGVAELGNLLTEFGLAKQVFMKCLRVLELPNDFSSPENNAAEQEIIFNAKILNQKAISDRFSRNFHNFDLHRNENEPNQSDGTARNPTKGHPACQSKSTQTDSNEAIGEIRNEYSNDKSTTSNTDDLTHVQNIAAPFVYKSRGPARQFNTQAIHESISQHNCRKFGQSEITDQRFENLQTSTKVYLLKSRMVVIPENSSGAPEIGNHSNTTDVLTQSISVERSQPNDGENHSSGRVVVNTLSEGGVDSQKNKHPKSHDANESAPEETCSVVQRRSFINSMSDDIGHASKDVDQSNKRGIANAIFEERCKIAKRASQPNRQDIATAFSAFTADDCTAFGERGFIMNPNEHVCQQITFVMPDLIDATAQNDHKDETTARNDGGVLQSFGAGINDKIFSSPESTKSWPFKDE